MGRPSTGAWVTFEAARIDLSYLLKQGYIRKNCKTVGSLYWNINGEPTGNISIESMYALGECWIRLLYHVTDSKGLKTDYDYKIYIERVPSNLGKGEVLYFLCPLTGQRCRILYRAYGSRKWFCREAYRQMGNRLYYECQQNSKLNHYNNRWWQLDKQSEIMEKQRATETYKGRYTRRALRYMCILAEQNYLDRMRWGAAGMVYGVRNNPQLRPLLERMEMPIKPPRRKDFYAQYGR